MARTAFVRLAGAAGIASAALAVAALVGFVVVVGSDPIADAATGAGFYVPALAALASVALLGLALVGLFLHQEERLGRLGAAAFGLALVGTIAAAGAQWTYVFVVPHFAPVVPELVNESTGSVLAGFVVSYALLALGWILAGLATLRTGLFPRWMPLLLVGGAAIAFLPLPSRTLVLTVAAALLGLRMLGREGRTQPVAMARAEG